MKTRKNSSDDHDVMGQDSEDHDTDVNVMDSNAGAAADNIMNEVLGAFYSLVPSSEDFDRERSAANAELIELLNEYLTSQPHLRFGQALRNLDLATDDCALVEPQVHLARARAALKRK